MQAEVLMAHAQAAQAKAYAPYSHFRVGAALLADSGVVYHGANVENSSYGLSICAERVAVFQGVTAGDRTFSALAVAGSGEKLVYPCGACLQVLAEFAPALKIYLLEGQNKIHASSLTELLPCQFSLDHEEGFL